MNQPTKRTQEELQKLLNDWRHDPCWDLWISHGFEAHASELEVYDHAYSMKSHKSELQVKTLVQDLYGGTADEDVDLADAINDGWEIIDLTVQIVAPEHRGDGFHAYEAHPMRIVTLKRVVQFPSAREELLEEARVALMESATDAPEVDEADRLARENHALAMLYEDAMSGDELEAEADLSDQHYSLWGDESERSE